VTLPPDFARDLRRATLAAYERYAVEVVERYGLCPWARAARESGEVVLRVVFSRNPDDFEESLDVLGELSRAAEAPEIALVIYPLLDVDRLAFEDYTRRLRTHAELGSPKLDAFAMAAFHPAATPDFSHPDRLVPYVRRSPDPTLQLVRKSAISSIKGLTSGTAFLDVSTLSLEAFSALAQPQPKPLRERIAEQNLLTVTQVGPAVIDAVLADIANDRERAHAALLARYGERGPRRA
jgi:hypothetical protein